MRASIAVRSASSLFNSATVGFSHLVVSTSGPDCVLSCGGGGCVDALFEVCAGFSTPSCAPSWVSAD